MDSELKKMVEESLELSRENNKILHSLRSSARWGRVFRIFYWVVIIGSMLGAYYYLQPFLKVITTQYQMGASFFEQIQNGSLFDQFLNQEKTTPQ